MPYRSFCWLYVGSSPNDATAAIDSIFGPEKQGRTGKFYELDGKFFAGGGPNNGDLQLKGQGGVTDTNEVRGKEDDFIKG